MAEPRQIVKANTGQARQVVTAGGAKPVQQQQVQQSAPVNVSAMDVAREVPNTIIKGIAKTIDFIAPGSRNFIRQKGGVIGEGIAYATSPEVRKQYNLGNTDILTTVTNTTQKDLWKNTINAGVEVALYRAIPPAIKTTPAFKRAGIGAIEGMGMMITDGVARDKTPEEIVRSLPLAAVFGAGANVVAPKLISMLQKDVNLFKKASPEIKTPTKGGDNLSPNEVPNIDKQNKTKYVKSEFAPSSQRFNMEPGRVTLTPEQAKDVSKTSLYHGTELDRALDILETGSISSKISNLDSVGEKTISLSRNKNVSSSFGDVVFEFDNKKLNVRNAPEGVFKGDKIDGLEVRFDKDISLDDVKRVHIIADSKQGDRFGMDFPITKIGREGRETVVNEVGTVADLVKKFEDKGIEVVVHTTDDEISKTLNKQTQKTVQGVEMAGSGETKASALAKRLSAVDDPNVPTYNTSNQKANIAKGEKYYKDKPLSELMDVLEGKKNKPKELSDIETNALLPSLLSRTDEMTPAELIRTATIRDIRSLTATQAGKENSILQQIDPDNPINAIADVNRVREGMAVKRAKADSAKTMKKSEMSKIEKLEMTKQNKINAFKEALKEVKIC